MNTPEVLFNKDQTLNLFLFIIFSAACSFHFARVVMLPNSHGQNIMS